MQDQPNQEDLSSNLPDEDSLPAEASAQAGAGEQGEKVPMPEALPVQAGLGIPTPPKADVGDDSPSARSPACAGRGRDPDQKRQGPEEFLQSSQGKVKKLVTALYMVTNCLEDEEPLKKKLRILGVELVSDAYLFPLVGHGELSYVLSESTHRIGELLSFLEVTASLGYISEMNYGILKSEFKKLKECLDEKGKSVNFLFPEDLFKEDLPNTLPLGDEETPLDSPGISHEHPSVFGLRGLGAQPARPAERNKLGEAGETEHKGHIKDTNFYKGHEQKAGVLYKETLSDQRSSASSQSLYAGGISPHKRREKIIKLIKQKIETCPEGAKRFEGVTIKDISKVIKNCSQKTIQRDLTSLVREGTLKKIGEKRWSRYLLA